MNELDEFEEKLKQAMLRVDAPQGFADRVAGRVAQERQEAQQQERRQEVQEANDRAREARKGRLIAMPRRSAWFAIAAMLLIGIVLGGWQWRQQQLRRERQEAEVVRRQFEMAMQVTGRTLVEIQERIGRAGEVHTSRKRREVEQ